MILRGPQVSETKQPVVLTAPPVDVPRPPPPKLVQVLGTSAPTDSVPMPVAPEKPKEASPALSFEAVVAWLAVQDQATRNDCAAILATEVAGIYERAKLHGAAEGREVAAAALQADTAALLATLSSINADAEREFTARCAHLEAVCVDVIVEALGKIAGPLLATQDAALGAVRAVLDRVREERKIVVRVAREDFAFIGDRQAELAAAFGGRTLEVVADARVELGGAVVETNLGNLDGRFEVQLRELFETLRLCKAAAVPSLKVERS